MDEVKAKDKLKLKEVIPERLINKIIGKKDLFELLSTYGKLC